MAPTPDIIVAVAPSSGSKDGDENGFVNVAFENESERPGSSAFGDVVLTNLEEKNRARNTDAGMAAPPKDVDFDDLLPHIGEFGRYQKILFFLMIPFAFFIAFVYFTQIFITLVPEKHWCRIPELMHLSQSER